MISNSTACTDKLQMLTLTMVSNSQEVIDKTDTAMEQDKLMANLIQRNKDLEQFAYIISHNLRAPVANILGLSYLLQNAKSKESNNEEILNALHESVNHLDKVIVDLNQLIQLDGMDDGSAETVMLSQLVQDIWQSIGQLTAQQDAKIICDFDVINELYTQKSYLYSIIQNLIINSIKYRHPDQDPVINVVSKFEGNKVCIYVKDNGRGIDLSKHGHQLFGLYKRFDRSVDGKGMGLYMVKMQIERLGGSISVQSKPDAGTEFRLEFPIMMAKF